VQSPTCVPSSTQGVGEDRSRVFRGSWDDNQVDQTSGIRKSSARTENNKGPRGVAQSCDFLWHLRSPYPASPFALYHHSGSGGRNILTFTRGPEYFTRFRPPNPEGSHSTRSDSKRSSINQVTVVSALSRSPCFQGSAHLEPLQNKFRVSLIARDYGCLVTEVVYDYCTASH
jgi:hypothetical protein